MTKGELRKARKEARANGKRFTGELTVASDNRDRGSHGQEFSESPRGYRARENWSRRYDELNGAPESDYDC